MPPPQILHPSDFKGRYTWCDKFMTKLIPFQATHGITAPQRWLGQLQYILGDELAGQPANTHEVIASDRPAE